MNEYTPDYPKTLDDAIEMMNDLRKEYVKSPPIDDYNLGAAFGLRTAVGILNELKRNFEKGR